MDWQVPLVVAASAFGVFMLWRVRPTLRRDEGESPQPLKEAKKRVAAAKNDQERALALADAGDACARKVGRTGSTIGYYLRAMRTDPTSSSLVLRASRALARRPLALEALLWRRLGAEPWTAATREPALTALRSLVSVYDARNRTRVRADAVRHLLSTLGEAFPPAPVSPSEAALPIAPEAPEAPSAKQDQGHDADEG
jgi:hypothetical protein